MRELEQQVMDQVAKARNILIVIPGSENGDSIASALALFLFLKKSGKDVEIIRSGAARSVQTAFLPSSEAVKEYAGALQKFIISLDLRETKVSEVKYAIEGDKLNFIIVPRGGFFTQSDITSYSGDFKHDLICTIGAQDLDSLGEIYEKNTEFFYKTPLINIDISSANEEFGQINLVRVTAVACSEIIYSLFESSKDILIDEDTATCLLAGLIIKTKSFKIPTITPQSLEAAARLIELGARREEIVNHLYRSRSMNSLKLWGRVLARLAGNSDNSLVWSALTEVDFSKTGASEDDLLEVVDEMVVNIPQAKVIVLLYEKSMQEGAPYTNGLIYTMRNIDAIALTRPFNPTGSRRLARISLASPLQNVSNDLTAHIDAFLSKLGE